MKAELIRKQIYLTEEEDKRLRQEAVIESIPQTEVIRRALNHYFKERTKAHKSDRRRLLESVVGMFGEDMPTDLSAEHDKYIYGGGGS
jgi:hypothetical protein